MVFAMSFKNALMRAIQVCDKSSFIKQVQIRGRHSGDPTRPGFSIPDRYEPDFFQPDISRMCHPDSDPIRIGPARFVPT